jgi:hypothetical protein
VNKKWTELELKGKDFSRQRQSYIRNDGQSASLSWCQSPIWGPWSDSYQREAVLGLLMWGAIPDERTGLQFTNAAEASQHSHSLFRIQQVSWPYFTVWDLKLSQPGVSGPRIYIPKEQVGLVIPPGTGCRLLSTKYLFTTSLRGSRWKHRLLFFYCCGTTSVYITM